MRELELEFRFKGERNYVHGSDVFVKIVEELNRLGYNEWQFFELNIKQICHNNLTCHLSEQKRNYDGEVINFALKKGSKKLFGSMIENSNKITSRYPFREEDIFRNCTIDHDGGTITYNNPDNAFLTIEIILSSAKYFLEEVMDSSVKWYFRRIKLTRPIGNIESHPVTLKKVSEKNGFIGFDLFIGDKQFGDGYAASISPALLNHHPIF